MMVHRNITSRIANFNVNTSKAGNRGEQNKPTLQCNETAHSSSGIAINGEGQGGGRLETEDSPSQHQQDMPHENANF